MNKVLAFAAILILACFAAINVYAAMMRDARAPTVFEAQQRHHSFDEAGTSRPANRQVVSYLADGTRVVAWQSRWMELIGIAARTVLTADGRQGSYMDPLPVPLKTTKVVTAAMMRKTLPAFAKTCVTPSGGKVIREELLLGYRTALIERFEPQMGMRILYWDAIDAVCTTLKTEVYKKTDSGWHLSYALETLRVTPAETSAPVLARLF